MLLRRLYHRSEFGFEVFDFLVEFIRAVVFFQPALRRRTSFIHERLHWVRALAKLVIADNGDVDLTILVLDVTLVFPITVGGDWGSVNEKRDEGHGCVGKQQVVGRDGEDDFHGFGFVRMVML